MVSYSQTFNCRNALQYLCTLIGGGFVLCHCVGHFLYCSVIVIGNVTNQQKNSYSEHVIEQVTPGYAAAGFLWHLWHTRCHIYHCGNALLKSISLFYDCMLRCCFLISYFKCLTLTSSAHVISWLLGSKSVDLRRKKNPGFRTLRLFLFIQLINTTKSIELFTDQIVIQIQSSDLLIQ